MSSSMPRLVALDIDLGRIHAWSNVDGRVCYNAPEFPFDALLSHDAILAEVASPVDTSGSGAESYNRRKWAVANCLQAGRLWQWAAWNRRTLLFSSADRWTLGYSEAQRNVIAGTAGQDNHDIRSCREMIFFYGTNPEKWVPAGLYYTNLSTAGKPKRKS